MVDVLLDTVVLLAANATCTARAGDTSVSCGALPIRFSSGLKAARGLSTVMSSKRLCMGTGRLKRELKCRIGTNSRCITIFGGRFDGAMPCNVAAFCCSDAGIKRVLFGGVMSCRTPFRAMGGTSKR